MRVFRGFYNWDGGSETERLRQHVAELEAVIAEQAQSIDYWKARYENIGAALNYTEETHAAELDALRTEREEAVAYWKHKYDAAMATMVSPSESTTVKVDTSESWYDLLEGYAQ